MVEYSSGAEIVHKKIPILLKGIFCDLFWHHSTMIFGLLTLKVDHSMPLCCRPPVPIYIKVGSFIYKISFKNISRTSQQILAKPGRYILQQMSIVLQQVGGQRSRPHEAEDKFIVIENRKTTRPKGLRTMPLEASFSTLWVE